MPLAVAYWTRTSWATAADRLTLKVAVPSPSGPSTTVTSLMVIEVSSLRMVPWPWESWSAALVGLTRLMKKVSSASAAVKPYTVTVMERLVWPGVKVTVPLAAR